MAWNLLMPTAFADGQVVDEQDLNPIVENVWSLRYSTIFLGGQRRTTAWSGIGNTEQIVLQTPSVVMETGVLHKIEGMLKYTGSVSGIPTGEVKIHEGSSLAGATLMSYQVNAHTLNAGFTSFFAIYSKTLSTVSRQYTIGFRVNNGVGNMQADPTSWIAILRSGDNVLMNEV